MSDRKRKILLTPTPFSLERPSSEASEAYEEFEDFPPIEDPEVTGLDQGSKSAAWRKKDAGSPTFKDILDKIKEIRAALVAERVSVQNNLRKLSETENRTTGTHNTVLPSTVVVTNDG